MIRVKESIRKLGGYAVLQNQSMIKLNQNESPFDLPQPIKEEIWQQLNQYRLNRYPDDGHEQLRQKIADYAGVAADQVLAGNSSNELIQTLIYAFCHSKDRILTVTPTFSVYKRVADIMEIGTLEVPLKDDFSFDIEAILEASKQAKMIILASPNNPTGTVIELEDISKIAARFPGPVVIDEAYFEFYRQSVLNRQKKQTNIIALRTFSKAMSLASSRLGYLTAYPGLIKQLAKSKLPFSVGLWQQVAGSIILGHRLWWEKNVDFILQEKEKTVSELKKIDKFELIPSRANFFLFHYRPVPSAKLFQLLYKRNILVRSFSGGLVKDWLRASIGTADENKKFIRAIQEIVQEYR